MSADAEFRISVASILPLQDEAKLYDRVVKFVFTKHKLNSANDQRNKTLGQEDFISSNSSRCVGSL